MRNETSNEYAPTVRCRARWASTILLGFLVLAPCTGYPLDVLIGTSQARTFNHHAGRFICRMVNGGDEDLDCSALPADEGLHSSDQIHTLTNVQNGALDLGIVDSSIQHDAANSSGRFEFFDIDLGNIRSLFSLNGIPFTVVVRTDAKLKTLDDLQGRRINVGNPGSPQRTIMNNLMAVNNWGRKDFQLMEELPAAQSQDTLALCFGTVDAVIRFDVHPDSATRHMTELCGAELMPVTGSAVDRLIGVSPYYSTLSIPAGTYASNESAVQTFGLIETVVASADLDEETVYTLVRLVFEQLDRLRSAHPAFGALDPERMHSAGIHLPLHPGALRYYREQGWKQ